MPHCTTCNAECRGKQCRSCYQNGGRDSVNGTTYGLDSSLDPNMSGIDTGLQLINAAFTNTAGILGPDTAPSNLEEMYNMFVQMKSSFSIALQEKDAKIDALSKKVEALEEAAKKTVNTKTPENVVTEMKEYSQHMKTMKAAVAAQQKSLEDLHHDRRSKNLVITGVPEPEGPPVDARKEDQRTTESIFTTVGCPGVSPCHVTRLGKKREVPAPGADEDRPPPPRPLLVTFNSVTEVRSVMKETHKLKDHEQYGRVFIKRDQHPLIRKEWNRLREFAKKEKAAPLNVGCTIRVDYEKKAVTRDGVSILEFVSPFRAAGPNQSE